VKAVALGLAAVLLSSSAPGAGQPPTPVHWTIEREPATVRRGETLRIQLKADIDQGWHLYALEQPADGPKATTISIAPQPAFMLARKRIDRPAPKSAVRGAREASNYYEGRVVFGLPVTVGNAAPSGAQEITVTAKFQACNNTMCLRRTTVTQKVAVTVTGPKE
jgi:thiol:disulfide interchange protein DsbD